MLKTVKLFLRFTRSKKSVKTTDNKKIRKSNWTELKPKSSSIDVNGSRIGSIYRTKKKNEKGRWCLKVLLRFCEESMVRASWTHTHKFKILVEQKRQKHRHHHHHHHHRHMWTFSWFVLINLWTVISIILFVCILFSCLVFSSSSSTPFFTHLLSSGDRFCFNNRQQQQEKVQGAK